jgi:hypothetical protein
LGFVVLFAAIFLVACGGKTPANTDDHKDYKGGGTLPDIKPYDKFLGTWIFDEMTMTTGQDDENMTHYKVKMNEDRTAIIFDEIIVNGEDYSPNPTMVEYAGKILYPFLYSFYITLNEDGTCTTFLDFAFDEDEEEPSAPENTTFTFADDKVTIIDEDGTEKSIAFADNKLTVTINDENTQNSMTMIKGEVPAPLGINISQL